MLRYCQDIEGFINMNCSDIITISPNMVKIFEECPFKFYYRYIEQIPVPLLDKGFQLGKNMHALASYYLKGINVEKFEKVLTEKEQNMWEWLKNCQYFKYEVVGTEKSIASKIGDYWIGGRLDAIVKNNEDYYILDYKTGGVSDDMIFNPQTMIYLIMCDNFIQKYNSLSFIYLDLKNYKEVKINFSEEFKQIYTDKLKTVCCDIMNFNPKKYDKKTDCKCEFANICGEI